MDDQKNIPVELDEQSQAQEEAQSSSVGAEKVEETPQEQTAPSKEGTAPSKEGAENIKSSKGTRLERRIEKLQEKLEAAKTQEDKERIQELINRLIQRLQTQQVIPEELLRQKPLIREDEYGMEIDPEELERRIAEREQQVILRAVQAVENKRRYEAALQEHISDWEKVLQEEEIKNDKDLKNFLEAQYRAINFSINPLTGQEDFFPVAKPSEIYAQIKKILDKKRAEEGAKTLSELRKQSQESSVPPATDSIETTDFEEQALYERARQTGSDEDWAQVLKKRLFSK